MFAWTMTRAEQTVLTNVGAEVPVEVRSDFRNAMADLVQGVRDREVSPDRLQKAQRALLELVRKPKGTITEEDLTRLTRALRGELDGPAFEAPVDLTAPRDETSADPAAVMP